MAPFVPSADVHASIPPVARGGALQVKALRPRTFNTTSTPAALSRPDLDVEPPFEWSAAQGSAATRTASLLRALSLGHEPTSCKHRAVSRFAREECPPAWWGAAEGRRGDQTAEATEATHSLPRPGGGRPSEALPLAPALPVARTWVRRLYATSPRAARGPCRTIGVSARPGRAGAVVARRRSTPQERATCETPEAGHCRQHPLLASPRHIDGPHRGYGLRRGAAGLSRHRQRSTDADGDRCAQRARRRRAGRDPAPAEQDRYRGKPGAIPGDL